MDSTMRDLEQIREQEPRGSDSTLPLVALLVVVTVSFVFAMGMWMDEGPENQALLEDDPLARLDRAAGLAAMAQEAEMEANEGAEPEAIEVDATRLTFPQILAAEDERPEVAAALAAARAELAHPDPLPQRTPSYQHPQNARIVERLRALPNEARPSLDTLPAVVPAGLAAAPGSAGLIRGAAHDPLMAAALPAPEGSLAVSAGHDGEYTVQVISYDSPEGANAFAAGLRARGHRAFVVSAAVEGRGTMWRVRIGPFENMREARAYRRRFEQTERMNTIVVRRRPEPA